MNYTKSILTMLCVFAATLLVGCSSTKEYTYTITVKNESAGPVTIWLTKDGPPIEQGWRSPEQVAVQSPGHEERISGVLVPAGKTASTGPIKGQFQPGCCAWLRIYDGKYTSFSDLLAVSPKSPMRIDQALDPGINQVLVKSKNGRIFAEIQDIPATPARK